MKKQLSKLFIAVIAFLLSFNILTISVSAKSIDVNKPSSLEIVYRHNNTSYEGLNVKIYRVASLKGGYVYDLDEPFDNYSVDLNNVKSQEEWRSLATTLSSYVIADNLKPTAQQNTDADGVAKFENLRPGMYLTMGIQKKVGSDIVVFESFLTVIPYPSDDGMNYLYDLTVYPKCQVVTPSEDTIQYKVVKQWRDDGDTEKRPDSVTIHIYKDGVFIKKVTLSSKNNWTYSWVADNDGSDWSVKEHKVPNGYYVTITEKENFIIVTNSSGPPENPPVTTTKPSTETTTKPSTETTTRPSSETTTKPSSEITTRPSTETTTNTYPEKPTEKPTGDIPDYPTEKPTETPTELPTEIFTENPSGDDPDDDFKFPETGDKSSPEVYITVMCISGLIIILLSLEKKKKSNEKNKNHIS